MDSTFLEIIYCVITVLLLYLCIHSAQKIPEGSKKHFVVWIFFGCLFNWLSFLWLYSVYPLPWLDSGHIQLIGIFILHTILTFVSGIWYGCIGFAFIKPYKEVYMPIIFGFLLMISELCRSLAISLLYLGKESTVGFHLTAGTTGNALSITPLIELAYFGGVFGLSFFLGVLVYAMATLRKKTVYIGLVYIFLALIVSKSLPLPTHTPTTIGIVTTTIKTVKDHDYIDILRKENRSLFTYIYNQNTLPDIVVFPEDTRFFSFMTENEKEGLLKKFPSTLFIDGDTLSYEQGYVNASLLYKDKALMQVRTKEYLLAFNEYIPYIFEMFFYYIVGDALETYAKNHGYTRVISGKSVVHNNTRIATLICSEALSFTTLQKIKEEKPHIVFYQSKLNIFNNNPLFIMHLRSFSKVAAAQLRTPLISSNNDAPSFIINPYGKILYEIPTQKAYTEITMAAHKMNHVHSEEIK